MKNVPKQSYCNNMQMIYSLDVKSHCTEFTHLYIISVGVSNVF